MQQIAEWLKKLGMSEYAQVFAENRIDFSVLPDLTDQDLKDIGVVLGDRRKILRAIGRLDAVPKAVALRTEAPSGLFAAVQALSIEEGASDRRDMTLDNVVRDTSGEHLRANYHRLIARAVKGLDRSSAEARQLIYERAREALIAHLRCDQPGLPKADIVKERLALDEAIRHIEAEAVGKSIPFMRRPDGGAGSEPKSWPAARPDARERLLSGRSSMESEALSEFREVVREVQDFDALTPMARQAPPRTREAYEEEAIEATLDPDELYWFEFDSRQEGDRDGSYGADDERLTGASASVGYTRRGTRRRADTPRILVRRLGDTSHGADCDCGIGGSSFLGMVCDYGVLCVPQSH